MGECFRKPKLQHLILRTQIGIGAMLCVSLLGLGLGVYQQILIANAAGDHVSIQRMFSILSAVRIALNLVSMGGLLAVVWGLCSATRTVANEDDRLKPL